MRSSTKSYIVACCLAFVSIAAFAQAHPLVPSSRASDSPPPVVVEAADDDTAALANSVAQMAEDLATLRNEFAALERKLDDFMNALADTLAYQDAPAEVFSEESRDPEIEATIDAEEAGFDIPADPAGLLAEAGYTIVKEWGRSPEMVAEMNADISTLKGMVISVSPLSTDEDLVELGESLRGEFAEYDNLNIEVYDDITIARQFADTGTGDPDHRVLSVSKFQASGRDVILLIRGDKVTVVP